MFQLRFFSERSTGLDLTIMILGQSRVSSILDPSTRPAFTDILNHLGELRYSLENDAKAEQAAERQRTAEAKTQVRATEIAKQATEIAKLRKALRVFCDEPSVL